jgi:hypothetical protein
VADEYLPPVVTKLKGDIRDLVDAIAEAKAAMAAYDKQVQEESVRSSRTTGKTSGNALVEELRRTLRDGQLAEQDTAGLRGRIDTAFRKAGKDGAAGLYQEFAKALGPGGLDSTVGREVIHAFDQFGQTGGAAFTGEFGKIFSGGFMQTLGNMAKTPELGAVGGLMAVQLASMLLAGIGGAVEGAAGLGGILTGALVQLKTNPEVQGAAKDFGSWLGTEFKDETAVFAGPLEDAFKILKTDLRGPVADLGKDFAYLAPYVRDFASYIGAVVEKFMPGFNRMIQSSGPVLTELGHDLVYVADGLSTMFDEISKGGKGEVEALDTLFRFLGATLAATGFLIRGAADTFDGFVQVEKTAVDWTDKWLGSWTLAGPLLRATGLKGEVDGIANSFDGGGAHIDGFAKHVDQLTLDIARQKATVDALTKAWDDWFGLSMTLDQATLTYHQDVTALTDSIAQNGRTFDLNTKAGQANYGALLQAIQGAHDLRDAQIASGTSTAQANAQYSASVNYLITMASKVGLSKDQIALLVSQVDQLTAALQHLDKNVNPAHLSQLVGSGWTLGQGLAEGGYVAPGGIIHAAEGLLPPRSPGTLVLAGEPQTGGEVMIPQRGISTARAAALGTVAMAPYGMTVTPTQQQAQQLVIHAVFQLPDGRVAWEQWLMPGALQTKKQWGPVGL